MAKTYGQFCGLARAAEIVGERWTLLILRDLSVGEARFSELKAGLKGIAATMLASRLRDLEDAGLITKTETPASATYRLSAAGQGVLPALRVLSLWGASTMATPRESEVVTDRSLAAMLDATRTATKIEPFTVEISAGTAAAHATVTKTSVAAAPGRADKADLFLTGKGIRTLLAEPHQAQELLAAGDLEVTGDDTFLSRFAMAFHAPLTSPA